MIRLHEMMTTDVITLSPDLSIRDAAEALSEQHISGAPVVEGGTPIGMLTSSDVLEFVAGLGRDPAEVDGASQHNFLDDHTVEEAMTRGPLHALPPTASLREAAELMRLHSIHRVFVVDHGRLAGVVSALDITRALATGKAMVRTLVFPRATRST